MGHATILPWREPTRRFTRRSVARAQSPSEFVALTFSSLMARVPAFRLPGYTSTILSSMSPQALPV